MKESDSMGLAREVLANCSQIPLKSICGNNWPVRSLCPPYLTKLFTISQLDGILHEMLRTAPVQSSEGVWYKSNVPGAQVMLILTH